MEEKNINPEIDENSREWAHLSQIFFKSQRREPSDLFVDRVMTKWAEADAREKSGRWWPWEWVLPTVGLALGTWLLALTFWPPAPAVSVEDFIFPNGSETVYIDEFLNL